MKETGDKYAKYVVKQRVFSANHTTYGAFPWSVDIVIFAVINKNNDK
jgi:hypothetical protein